MVQKIEKYPILLGFVLFCAVNSAFGQEWLGYNTSNYVGINGVQYNPAMITQTNYGKYDISIIAADLHVENNYLFFDSRTITDPVRTFGHYDFKNIYVRQNLDGLEKSAIARINVQSPAFLLQVTKKDAIGFCIRPRAFVNADRVPQNLAQLIYEGLDYPLNWNRDISSDYMSLSANLWVEYDFSYARVLLDNKFFKIKGGVTFKFLQGLGAGGIGLRDYNYNFLNNDTLSVFNANVEYGLNDAVYDQTFAFDLNAPGFAFDFGVTIERYKYGKDRFGLVRKRKGPHHKLPGIFDPDETKYKWRIGFSVHDLGAIFYKRAPETRDFVVNATDFPLNVFNGVNSIADVNGVIATQFNMNGTDPNMTFIVPMHANIFGDVRFPRNFGLHGSFMMAFNQGTATTFKNHYLYQFTITPRWEIKWFGVYMPFWISQYFNPNFGISLRLGPLVIGTGDLLGHFIKGEYAGIDLHFALRIIIPRGKDRGGFGQHDKHRREAVCPAYQ